MSTPGQSGGGRWPPAMPSSSGSKKRVLAEESPYNVAKRMKYRDEKIADLQRQKEGQGPQLEKTVAAEHRADKQAAEVNQAPEKPPSPGSSTSTPPASTPLIQGDLYYIENINNFYNEDIK